MAGKQSAAEAADIPDTVNLDDPNTWPDDPDTLSKIAEASVARQPAPEYGVHADAARADAEADAAKAGTDEGGGAGEGHKEAATDKEAKGDAGKAGDAGDDTGTEAAETGSDAQGKADTADSAKADDQSTDGAKAEAPAPEGILARDGKHVIPYSVLDGERRQRQELEEENERLARELEETRRAQAPAAGESGDDTRVTREQAEQDQARAEERVRVFRERARALRNEQDEELKEYNEQRADELDALAEQMERNARLEQQLHEQRGYIESFEERARDEQRRLIRDAIDASPIVALWAADEDTTWMDRAESTYKHLMDASPEFRGLSVHERFQALPEKVEALYGVSPHRDKVASAATGPGEDKPEPKPEDVDKAVDKATEAARGKGGPTTLSDLPAGEGDKSETGRLEEMSGAALTRHFSNMTPEQREKALNRLV